MNSRALLSTLLIVSFHSFSHSQGVVPLSPEKRPLGIIDTIFVGGNEKTEPFVILDEMTLKRGMQATVEAMEFDRSRIYNLGLFTHVDIFYDSLAGTHFLFVDVRERWYVVPIPIFGFRDGDPKKVYFGGGILHTNFRGRNQKLYAAVAFGYDPSASFSFRDPLIDRSENLYFSASISTSSVKNRSVEEAAITGDFNERHYDLNGLIGKRFSLYETAGINPGYHIVQVSSYRPGRTASPTGRDGYLYCTVDFTRDSRDLRSYATQGALFSVYLTKYGFGESTLNFVRFGADIRQYGILPLDLTFAARLYASAVTGGLVPTYAHAYLGYGERIRGHFNDVAEGEDYAGATVELRFPLMRTRTFTFTAIPLPAEFSVWRIGVSAALFADAGSAWYRGARVDPASFLSGYGAGIYLLLPYDTVVRVEYARNELGKDEFILDLRWPI